MAMYQIPLPQGNPAFTQQTLLDGVSYTFHIHWNEREGAWYLSLHDSEDDPITSGRKMVADWPLLHRSVDSRLPPGMLYVHDISGAGLPATLDDLGERVILYYFDTDTIAEIVAGAAA